MSKYEALEPKPVWQIFGAMAAIPHGSGHEVATQAILKTWPGGRNLDCKADKVS